MKKTIFISIIILPFLFFNNIFAYNAILNIIEKGNHKICTIANIDDGDTFDIGCKNKDGLNEYIHDVRLLGTNSPDVESNGYKHCFYEESINTLYNIKNKKRELDVEFFGSDLCKDPFKGCRNLVIINDLETGIDLNERFIYKGFALKWINFSNIPNNIKAKYLKAEIKAKRNKNGLWGKCELIYNKNRLIDSPIPPVMTK